jgi:long-chain fatty acid transport protein
MRTITTSLLLVAGLGGIATANAFYINEHDARATGRGGTATATDTDPSAIVYNVAGIGLSEGTTISLGASLITPDASYTDLRDRKTVSDTSPQTVPHFGITSRVHDMIAIGLSFHLPYGLAVSWPSNSPQTTVVTKQSLRSYYITPAVAFNLDKIVRGLAVGVGADLVPATVELENDLVFGDATGHAKLGGDAFGVGARAGVMFHPAFEPRLSLGASWHSQVNLNFSGTGDFDIADPYRSQLPPDGDISTSVRLPQQAAGGAAFRPTPAIEVELNAVWTDWSKFNKIDITLPDGSHNVQAQDYEDTLTLRVGAEYKLRALGAAVRAGYIYDPTPIPTTTISARLPDINRHVVTVGGSYAITKSLDAHVALLWVIPGTTTASNAMPYAPIFKGSYDVSAFVASAMLNARFGK